MTDLPAMPSLDELAADSLRGPASSAARPLRPLKSPFMPAPLRSPGGHPHLLVSPPAASPGFLALFSWLIRGPSPLIPLNPG